MESWIRTMSTMNYGDINSVKYLPINQPVSVDAQRTPDGFARYLSYKVINAFRYADAQA